MRKQRGTLMRDSSIVTATGYGNMPQIEAARQRYGTAQS
jgi:hypothetical protein